MADRSAFIPCTLTDTLGCDLAALAAEEMRLKARLRQIERQRLDAMMAREMVRAMGPQPDGFTFQHISFRVYG
ncbi:MAG: hypothetical protein V4712_15175 [Pseudomonadota bacterium]